MILRNPRRKWLTYARFLTKKSMRWWNHKKHTSPLQGIEPWSPVRQTMILPLYYSGLCTCILSFDQMTANGFNDHLILWNCFFWRGKFFKDWFSCYVTAAFHKTATPVCSVTKLCNYLKLKCLQPKLRNFCKTKHVKSIGIMNHHVILRCN